MARAKKTTDYTPKVIDKLSVHARIQKPPLFDVNTGDPTGRDYIQMFEPTREWEEFVRRPQGYVILEVLHLPSNAKKVEDIK